MFAFVVLDLVFYNRVLSEEIGQEERLQNDLFCIAWNIEPRLTQPVNQ